MKSHWAGDLKAVGATVVPTTSNPPVATYKTTDDSKGMTGFLDLNPKKPEVQARYDAMSGSWAGIKASDAAVSKGIFNTDFAPLKDRR
jgi:hypothetical protein